MDSSEVVVVFVVVHVSLIDLNGIDGTSCGSGGVAGGRSGNVVLLALVLIVVVLG